jgi:ATPase family AAA domain-containing protein 1
MLKETELEIDFPLEELAQQADGLSGSDLKELCRNAAMVPVREYMKKMEGGSTAMEDVKSQVSPRNGCCLEYTLTVYEGH